jgi:hypothetical protein
MGFVSTLIVSGAKATLILNVSNFYSGEYIMRLFPHLSFNGNCREALTFYAELFGGTVAGLMPWFAKAIENISGATVTHIMQGDININGFILAGSDQFGACIRLQPICR